MNEWLSDLRVVWFLLGFLLLISEAMLPGVTLVFFGFGAWVTMLCLFVYPFTFTSQLVIFLGTSILSLIFFRAKIKTLFTQKRLQPNNIPDSLSSEILNAEVEVTEDIHPPHQGRVLLHGASWLAAAETDIPKGSRARVLSREGLVLTVERIEKTPAS